MVHTELLYAVLKMIKKNWQELTTKIVQRFGNDLRVDTI